MADSASRAITQWTESAIADYVRACLREPAAGPPIRTIDLVALPRIRPLIAGVLRKWSGMPVDWTLDLIQDFYGWLSREESPETIARNVHKLLTEDTEAEVQGAMYVYLERKLSSLGTKAYRRTLNRRQKEAEMLDHAHAIFRNLTSDGGTENA